AKKRDCFQFARFRFLKRAHDIFRLARSRKANEHIPRLAERRHLTCEYFIKAVIVCRRSEKSTIAREANRGMSGAVPWRSARRARSQNVPHQLRSRRSRKRAICFPRANIARSNRLPLRLPIQVS